MKDSASTLMRRSSAKRDPVKVAATWPGMEGADKSTDTVVLLTIRVRYDPTFPLDGCISLRKYRIGASPEENDSPEVSDVSAAIEVVVARMRDV